MKKLIDTRKLKDFDYIFVPAAISDYIPKKNKGKIKSGKEKLAIELKPAEKIIKNLRKRASKSKIIGFKAEYKKENLIENSFDLLKKNKLDYVVGNLISGFNKSENEIFIVDKKKKSYSKKDTKENLANFILDKVK